MADRDGWDEDTGVGEVPNGRSGQSRSARAAFRAIAEVVKKIDQHAADDREALGKIDRRLEAHGETLGTLRESAAATKAALEAMTSELRHRRDLEKREIDGDTTARIEREKTARVRMTSRAKVLIGLFTLGGTIAGAIGAYLAG